MQAADRDAVRAVARLPDGRLPAPGQALAGALAERLAEQLVEERAEDELGRVALDRVADAGARRGSRVEPRVDRASPSPSSAAQLVGRQEAGDRGAERDRRRLGAGKPVDLVGLERGDALEEAGERLGRIGRPVPDGPRAAARSARCAGRGRRRRGSNAATPRSRS